MTHLIGLKADSQQSFTAIIYTFMTKCPSTHPFLDLFYFRKQKYFPILICYYYVFSIISVSTVINITVYSFDLNLYPDIVRTARTEFKIDQS